jgi:hypothetical protein
MGRRRKPDTELSCGGERSRKSRERRREIMKQIDEEVTKLKAILGACSPVEELRAAIGGSPGRSTRARETLIEVQKMLKSKTAEIRADFLEEILRKLRS